MHYTIVDDSEVVIIAKSCIGTTSNFQKRLLFNCLFIHHLTNMSLSRFDFHENNIWNQEKVILATKRFVLWVELRYVRWKLLFVARKIFMIYSSAYRRYNQKSLHQFQGYHNMIDKITCIMSLKIKSYNPLNIDIVSLLAVKIIYLRNYYLLNVIQCSEKSNT